IDEVTVTVGGPGAGATAPVAVVEVRGTAVGADVGSVADVNAAVPCASVAVLGAGSCAPEGTTGPSGASGVVGVHLADTRVDAGLGLVADDAVQAGLGIDCASLVVLGGASCGADGPWTSQGVGLVLGGTDVSLGA